MSLNVHSCVGLSEMQRGNMLKNMGLSSTHTRLPTHRACHRVLFCKGQLPRGRRSTKHPTVRHPERSHMHCTQLQNNPSCASATTSASLPEGSSCNTSTMRTYKEKGSSHHTAHGGDVPPGTYLSVHEKCHISCSRWGRQYR